MKEFIKKYYRDTLTGMLMSLSLAFTFFMVLNCVRLVGVIEHEDKIDGYVKWVYANIEPLNDIETDEEQEEFGELIKEINMFEILKENSSNVSLYWGARVNNSEDGGATVQYVVSYNEEFNRKIIEGELPKKDFSNGCVLVNEKAKKAVEYRDNKMFVEIDSEEYEVSGIIRDTSISGNDEEFILFAEAMTKEQQEKVMSDMNIQRCMIHIGSDEVNPMSVYASVGDKLSNYSCVLRTIDGIGHSENEIFSRIMNIIIQPIMIIFSFANVFVVTGIWVKRRLKECAIRKAFGATHGMIMMHLMKEMFKCVLVSFVLAIIIQLIYVWMTGKIFAAIIYFNSTSAKIILGVFLIIMAILCHYGKLVKKTEPVTAIRTM